MKRSTRSAGRTSKLNGRPLRYALSEWQWNVVLVEATVSGRSIDAVADEMAERFFHADLVADHVIDVMKRRTDYALALIQSMLDDGAIDATTVFALLAERSTQTTAERQRRAVGARYDKTRTQRAWVTERWHIRAPGEFKTRDEFVAWCLVNCPGGIDTDHDRVRDRWIPSGKAALAGQRYRR